MASQSLFVLIQAFHQDFKGLRARCIPPVLVWEPPRISNWIDITDVSGTSLSGDRGEPVILDVVKGASSNAFPFGVTIGHAENNDVVLRHHLVSRFHAYVKMVGGKRCLVDAASRNGTWIDGRRLGPTVPEPLSPRATLRLGGPEVTWLEPAQIVDWLAERLESGARRAAQLAPG